MTGIDVHMRETDAFSWSMEADPILRMTVVAVGILDGAPDWDEVVRRMERVTRAVPLFRQRVLPTPGGIAPPKWVVDPNFDLGWHIRRVAVPAPGDRDAVLRLAASLGSSAFDPAHPLWEVWLVDGLTGGGAAWIAKVHHTLTDGVGGMQLLAHMFDVDGTPLATTASSAPPPLPGATGALALVRGAVAHNVDQVVGAAKGGLAALGRTLVAARHDPRGAVTGAAATWQSLLETLAPTGEQLSTVMTGRSLSRHYGTVDVPLDGLRAAGHTIDGTVNDAFLAGITGGLRRYHEQHGATVAELRMTLPINVRQPGDAAAGNRIALVRLQLPVWPAEVVARMREIHRRTDRWKNAPGLAYTEAAYAVVNYLPASYLQGLAKHVDFVASNVPGFPIPVQLAGPRLVAFYAFGPTGGTALNVTMMSYGGAVHIGVDADAAAIPDLDVFLRCLREGYDEVLALAPRPAAPHTVRREPATRRRAAGPSRPRATSSRRAPRAPSPERTG